MTFSAEDLQRAEKAYRKATDAYEQARRERNGLVKDAVEAGWSLGKVAEATGLTRSRIAQIKMIDDEY